MLIFKSVDDQYRNFIVQNTVPKTMTIHDIRDATLQILMDHVKLDDWHKCTNESLKPYIHVKDELSVSPEGILLRGTRIVIPETLQQQTIKLAHDGHQGLTKCKMLLREKVWFPSMDKKAEEIISQCIYCAANTPQNIYEPLQMSELPKSKWLNLSADFYGPLPTGEMLLVVMDECSRYPVVEIVHSTSANSTIAALDRVLSMFSIPEVLKTDNGPPFNSEQFANYAAYMGFKIR